MTIADELKANDSPPGLEQGLAEGLVRARRQVLERLMAAKFGPPSAAVSARIEAADLELLDDWLERILDADTAEAVVEP
jgi:hypothetical protein